MRSLMKSSGIQLTISAQTNLIESCVQFTNKSGAMDLMSSNILGASVLYTPNTWNFHGNFL